MSDQGTTASRRPDKRKQREARNDLSRYLNKLKQICNTFETANDWAEFISELNNILQLYKFEIPGERQNGLTQAMNPTIYIFGVDFQPASTRVPLSSRAVVSSTVPSSQ